MNDQFYLLKIQLLEIEPKIWRRFIVPADITLDRLHDVVQIIMGWKDYHLHQFTINNKRYTEDPESKEDGAVDGKYQLNRLIKRKGLTFDYLYDFGDGWRHEITLEDNRYSEAEHQYRQEDIILKCLEGARACPPEDVGSYPGYGNFCRAMKYQNHEEHESLKAWYAGMPWHDGVMFDSEKFDSDKANYELLKYLRWSRDRERFWYEIE